MAQYTRDFIVDYGKQRGQTAGDIDYNLKKFGYDGLTVGEFNKISPIQNIGKDAGRNAVEFGKAIMTLPGLLAKTAYEEGVPGLIDIAKKVPEGIISPYNLSYDKIKRGDINIWDILQGAKENPVNTAMDIVGLSGLTKVGKGLPQALSKSKLAKHLDNVAPNIRKAFLPTKEEKLFNRALAHADVGGDIATKELQKAGELLGVNYGKKGVDRLQVTNNLLRGLTGGEEATLTATKLGRELGRSLEKEIQGIGALTNNEMALNRQAQYMVYSNPYKDLTHGEALDFIDKVDKGRRVPKHIKELVKEAKEVDATGNLVYIPQLLENNRGVSEGLGEAVMRLMEKDRPKDYFSNVREIGNANPEQLSKNLIEEFNVAIKQIKNAYATDEALQYLRSAMGQEATFDKVKALSDNAKRNEVVVPKKYFTEKLRKDLVAKGGRRIVENLLNDNTSIGKILRKPELAKDYIIINKNDIKAVANSLDSIVPSGTLGKLIGIFKTGVLGRPKWFAENRIDNWSNMAMSGVDFGEAVPLTFKYIEKLPQELDLTTAYQSLTGLKTSKLSYGEGFKLAVEKLKNAWDSKAPLDFLKALNTITGSPIYRLESYMEKFERATCLMDQINKYAKANGISVERAIVLVNKDKSLFWDLYKKVDDILGDYTGRNYYLPNHMYKLANLAMPFWKYPTQSLRLWGKQAYNNPIRYQMLASAPSEIGREYNEELIKKYNLDPKNFSGGVLHKEPSGGAPLETLQLFSPGVKFAAIPEMFENIMTPGTGKLPLFPVVDPINSLINFKNPFGRTPTMKGVIEYNGKLYTKDEKGRYVNYEPTIADRIKLMARGLLDSNVHAIGTTRFSVMPTAYSIVNKINNKVNNSTVPMYSQYDTTLLPFGGYNTLSMPKTTSLEMVGKQIGVRTPSQYPTFKMTKNQTEKLRRYIRAKDRKIKSKLRRDTKR